MQHAPHVSDARVRTEAITAFKNAAFRFNLKSILFQFFLNCCYLSLTRVHRLYLMCEWGRCFKTNQHHKALIRKSRCVDAANVSSAIHLLMQARYIFNGIRWNRSIHFWWARTNTIWHWSSWDSRRKRLMSCFWEETKMDWKKTMKWRNVNTPALSFTTRFNMSDGSYCFLLHSATAGVRGAVWCSWPSGHTVVTWLVTWLTRPLKRPTSGAASSRGRISGTVTSHLVRRGRPSLKKPSNAFPEICRLHPLVQHTPECIAARLGNVGGALFEAGTALQLSP